jgi:propanol-preferring alcohol dehydrogenase
MGPLVSGLATRGKLIVAGVPPEAMQLSAFPLVFGGRSIYGTLAGTAIETEDALAFSVLGTYARKAKHGSAWCW